MSSQHPNRSVTRNHCLFVDITSPTQTVSDWFGHDLLQNILLLGFFIFGTDEGKVLENINLPIPKLLE